MTSALNKALFFQCPTPMLKKKTCIFIFIDSFFNYEHHSFVFRLPLLSVQQVFECFDGFHDYLYSAR